MSVEQPAASTKRGRQRLRDSVDFDLHGLVHLRLLDPTPEDIISVCRQIGTLKECRFAGDADICIRFVDKLSTRDLRYVEGKLSGYTLDDFFILSNDRLPVRVKIPFERIGKGFEIVCESGSKGIPLLRELLNVTVLGKGTLPLHASAFNFRETGMLVVGAPHGGKTSALLGFMEAGAEYVGDDFVLVTPDGREMLGVPSALDLADWQLRQIPNLGSRIGPVYKLVAGSFRKFDLLTHPWLVRNPSFPANLLRRTVSRFQRSLRRRFPPEEVSLGAMSGSAQPKILFLMVTHEAPQIRVEPADAEEVLQRIALLARCEAAPLFNCYLAHKFAFPHRTNHLIEQMHEIEGDLLRSALGGLNTYVVYHPRPLSLRRLYEAMWAACENDRAVVDRREPMRAVR